MATSRRSNNVSANEIAAYTGNAAAGLAGTGANANAPDNAPLTQTARDLALASFQGNQILFRQFKDDMDKAYKMLDDDALIPDQVTEEDRPLIEEKKKKLLEIFNSVNGDLMNNPEAYRKFTATAQDAKSTIKHSQKWYLWRNAELERRKAMTNPVEQAEFDKAMAGQQSKKQQNFWALPDPYAPITDYKLDIVAAPPVFGAPVQTRDGDEVVTTTAVDPAATFDQYTKLFGQKNNTHQFQRYVTQFLSDPAAMDRVNARLKEKFGDRVAAINPAADRADQIAAKIALADNDAQKQTREFDKDRAANALGYARIRSDERQNAARIAADKQIAATRAAAGGTAGTTTPDFGNIIDGVNTETVYAAAGGQLVDSDGTPLRLQNGTLTRADGGAPRQISRTSITGGAPTPVTGPVEVAVPKSGVNDVILSTFNKRNEMRGPNQKNEGSEIKENGNGQIVFRIDGGQIAGVQTSKGTFADRNEFEDITQKEALRGVTKQKPATNIGEYGDAQRLSGLEQLPAPAQRIKGKAYTINGITKTWTGTTWK